MTPFTRLTLGWLFIVLISPAAAQQPARSGDSRNVTLPLSEYNRLLDSARRPGSAPAPPPLAAVLADADLQVLVGRESVSGTFNLTGTVLHDGLNRVRLLSGSTVLDAGVAGRPLPLLTEGDAHWAMLPGPGPFAVVLEWGAGLTFAPGRASFTLPVPPAGSARARIEVPGEQADVRLSSGLITGRSVANGRTIVEAALEPGSSTDVSWSMRESAPAAAAREVRALADVYTLVTLADSDVRMAAIVDVTVVSGELRSVDVELPAGYELTSLAGPTIETTRTQGPRITVELSNPSARRHQLLIGLERPHDAGSFSLTTGLVTLPGVQRERGEVAFEGVGTLELSVAERDALRRMDVREVNALLQSLARLPLLSAYRYQSAAGIAPSMSFDVMRFGDSGVLAAVADRGTATTIVTTEGRMLTEVSLQIRNRAQPFLRVNLPPDATMVSVEVAGQPAKPAIASDGTRVPLLRPGFRPTGPYNVSFVYLQTGRPFASRGDLQLALPRMDLPINIVEWELFVPERYAARAVAGNVVARDVFRPRTSGVANAQSAAFDLSSGRGVSEYAGGTATVTGWVNDERGNPVAGVTVELKGPALGSAMATASTSESGSFRIVALPAGTYVATFSREGLSTSTRREVRVGTGATVSFDAIMSPGHSISVTVVGESPVVDVQNARMMVLDVANAQSVAPAPKPPPPPPPPPSQNVVNLQRRAAGVLPVHVEVPRAGRAYRFVKPLVVDRELELTLRYKRR